MKGFAIFRSCFRLLFEQVDYMMVHLRAHYGGEPRYNWTRRPRNVDVLEVCKELCELTATFVSRNFSLNLSLKSTISALNKSYPERSTMYWCHMIPW